MNHAIQRTEFSLSNGCRLRVVEIFNEEHLVVGIKIYTIKDDSSILSVAEVSFDGLQFPLYRTDDNGNCDTVRKSD